MEEGGRYRKGAGRREGKGVLGGQFWGRRGAGRHRHSLWSARHSGRPGNGLGPWLGPCLGRARERGNGVGRRNPFFGAAAVAARALAISGADPAGVSGRGIAKIAYLQGYCVTFCLAPARCIAASCVFERPLASRCKVLSISSVAFSSLSPPGWRLGFALRRVGRRGLPDDGVVFPLTPAPPRCRVQ